MQRIPRALLGALAVAVAGCSNAQLMPNMLGEAETPALGLTAAPARPRPAAATAAQPGDAFFASELRSAYAAYAAGDYERAMLGYERVAGRAEEPRIQIRALISLAMIRLLPSSEMHDDDAARVVLDELDRRIERNGLRYEFFGEMELLKRVAEQDAALAKERAAGKKLRKDLAARDAVIRQLRALSVETQ